MKRLLCAVFFLCLVLFCAACSPRFLSTQGDPAGTPPPSAGPRLPVSVTESYASTETVASAAPTAPQTAAPVATPATGDVPVTAFAGAAGLILICSAGLLMLRRI